MMDKSTSLYVLSHIGDQFCSVMQEERKAITQAGENGNKTSQSLSNAVHCDFITSEHWVLTDRLFIRDRGSENSPFTAQNSPANFR